MKNVKSLDNDEKNLQKIIDQKNILQLKCDELKQKIEDKNQKVLRLEEKKYNLDKENQEITKYHDRLVLKREHQMARRPAATLA